MSIADERYNGCAPEERNVYRMLIPLAPVLQRSAMYIMPQYHRPNQKHISADTGH